MPFIEILTNKTLRPEQHTALQHRMGELISLMPGKSEQWLMVHIEDGASLCFAGDAGKTAVMAQLRAFGAEQSAECYDALTEAVTAACTELLEAAPERVYVEYEVTSHWGWNGKNFKKK